MGSRQVSKDEVARYGRSVWNYFNKLQKYKAVKAKFDAIKEEFELNMESLFHGRTCNSITITSHYETSIDEPRSIKITKVERTAVRWDIKKLKKRLPDDVFNKVVHKEYRIVGMQNLIQYLKSCGVDPKIFKQYIVVEESVDQGAIDHMGELGYISAQQISGCYIVDCAKPYFKVSAIKAKENE